ncbi:MAG: hypothetical protein J2P47_05695 [Acetobacteraceae bacterium]|nr:hypothetical protein [Acetobacteraceae bacterium]
MFPDRDEDLQARVIWLIERCRETQRDRANVYDRRERYMLFGAAGSEPVRYNRIESHIDLVSSFLYAPDHAFFEIAAAANAPEQAIRQVTALQDEHNNDFAEWGISDLFMDAITWSLVYNTMIVKQGWDDVGGVGNALLIAPHEFGVFREDLQSLDSQEAFLHTYVLEYYDAVQRCVRAGRSSDVPRIATTSETRPTPFPDLLNRLIISSTGHTNLAGNMSGAVNPDYIPIDNYQPRTQHPMVSFHELWAWDSECNDYRVFHVIEPNILIGDSRRSIQVMMRIPKVKKLLTERAQRVRPRRRRLGVDAEMISLLDTEAPGDSDLTISQCNPFLPGDHPFTKVQAYRKYNYFWGKAHIEALVALQDWLNERMEQIDDLLDRQAYPPRVGTGLGGISDEKFEAFGAADTYILEQMPSAKVEELKPEIPPDMFAEVKEIGALFLEASGLTDVIAGRGEEGVRSGRHARQAQRTGAGRIKKAALMLEPALTRIGDVQLRLKMRNDDTPIVPEGEGDKPGPAFYAYQVASQIKMRISAHAHSPLFVDDAREMAALLKRADAIDNDMLVRMVHPPNRDAIIHALKKKQRDQARLVASLPPEERMQLITGGKKSGGHR